MHISPAPVYMPRLCSLDLHAEPVFLPKWGGKKTCGSHDNFFPSFHPNNPSLSFPSFSFHHVSIVSNKVLNNPLIFHFFFFPHPFFLFTFFSFTFSPITKQSDSFLLFCFNKKNPPPPLSFFVRNVYLGLFFIWLFN